MYYNLIVQDIGNLPGFMTHYENELAKNRSCVQIKGNLEQNLARLPGETEMIFGQLQEIEAVLNYLNIQLRRIKQKHYKEYLEGYSRALTSRDSERYADASEEVLEYETLVNDVALLRNSYLGIMKGLECKNFMIGHITKLRTAGFENITL